MRNGRKNLIIGVICALVVLMAVGYATYTQQLIIGGTSTITSNWDVKITGVTNTTPGGNATNVTEPTFTVTTASFDLSLQDPGDYMNYRITIMNDGNLNAKLESLVITPTYVEGSPIKYRVTGIAVDDELSAGTDVTATLRVEYDSEFEGVPTAEQLEQEITVTLNFVQK